MKKEAFWKLEKAFKAFKEHKSFWNLKQAFAEYEDFINSLELNLKSSKQLSVKAQKKLFKAFTPNHR